MTHDNLVNDVYSAICAIPLIDPHSHIDPLRPDRPHARRHSRLPLLHRTRPFRRHGPGSALRRGAAARTGAGHPLATWTATTTRPNTLGSWKSRTAFLGLQRRSASRPPTPIRYATRPDTIFRQPDWEAQVFQRSNLEKIFLTNEFDDPLDGFDTSKYVPCLRTDDAGLSIRISPKSQQRLAKATGRRSRRLAGLAEGDPEAVRAFHRQGSQGVRDLVAAGLCPGQFADAFDLLDAGGALPRVRVAVRFDDRRQPPGVPQRRLPGAGSVRPAHAR